MPVEFRLVPCLSDNYAVLVRDPASEAVAVIDAPDAAPILDALDVAGWKATHILITHKHGDHVAGVPALKARFGAIVIGPEEARGPGRLDRVVGEGDAFRIGEIAVEVLATPGHTAGHISYVLPEAAAVFAGDTLFALGCGRVFEGEPATMWQSLKKLRALPDDAKLWCGHEYTLSNARFAVTVDPDNEALRKRLAEVERLRQEGRPTVPSTLAEEKATNPFLRCDDPAIAAAVGMSGADPAEIFAEIRARKNRA